MCHPRPLTSAGGNLDLIPNAPVLRDAPPIASYNEAVARKVVPPRGTLLSVLQGYQASDDFTGLAPRSRSDYVGKIKLIEKSLATFPCPR
jgi:hypothetical protein